MSSARQQRLQLALLLGCVCILAYCKREVLQLPDIFVAPRDSGVVAFDAEPEFDAGENTEDYWPDPYDDDAYVPPTVLANTHRAQHSADGGAAQLAAVTDASTGDGAADAAVNTRPMIDRPLAEVWPAVNTWSDAFEREFSDFVGRLGRGVAERRCNRMDRCLRNPEFNTLYDPQTDGNLYLNIDCADLPYVLRAYFSFKRKLPFGYTFWVDGSPSRAGKDPRYMVGIRPGEVRNWWRHRTFRSLLRDMGSWVHSGMYRVSARREGGDFYNVAVNRQTVRPGTTSMTPTATC